MKSRTLISTAIVASAALSCSARAEPERYALDPEHTTVAFLVEHLGLAAVLGEFHEVEGEYWFDEATGELADLRIIVETASVSTDHRERDEHLRSEDFLDVDAHPRMVFTADSARRLEERRFEIPGRLQLLGETRALTLTATWNDSAEYPFGDRHYAMGVSARGRLMRSDFGMTYGVANGFVADEVSIIIEIEGRRQ